MILAKGLREPDGSGAFHGAKAERTARFRILYGATRFISERQQPIRIAEQHPSFRREMEPFAFANEKRNAKILLELPDTRGDIGLNTMQPLRRARHASFAHYRGEDPQVRQIHTSLPEINCIINIHFI
jgi:hypothetical protein